MDCHKCIYSRSIPGDCHLSCSHIIAKHPELGMKIMVAIVSGQVNGFKTIGDVPGELSINPHGIKNGWASWPLNFDPIWIDECTFFKLKEEI